MSMCRFCGREMTARFGHLANHEARCQKRPVDQPFELAEVSSEDEPPRFRNANPRVLLGSGVQVWKRG